MLTSFNGLVPGTNGSGKGACGFGGIGEWCVRAAAEHYAAIPAFRQAGYRTLLIDDGWMDPNRTASEHAPSLRGRGCGRIVLCAIKCFAAVDIGFSEEVNRGG